MNHVHFSYSYQNILAISDLLANACITSSFVEEAGSIDVIGVRPQKTAVRVVDRCIRLLAREVLSLLVNGDKTVLECSDCRRTFLEVLSSHKCELSLRIMTFLQKNQKNSSCEEIRFNNKNKTIEMFLRKSASLVTQSLVAFPPVYFGPFHSLFEVEQRGFAVSTAASTKPVLATWHLADCIAIAGFDKENKIGFLFHVDEVAKVLDSLKQLVETFVRDSNRNYSFEYIFVGGGDSGSKDKEFLEGLFTSAEGQRVRFARRPHSANSSNQMSHENHDYRISSAVFQRDSYWARCFRLSRSIAIDLRYDDPLSQIMSYEPEINGDSVIHKRAKTIEEAEEFCRESTMKCALFLNCD